MKRAVTHDFGWRYFTPKEPVPIGYKPPRGWRLPTVGEAISLMDEGVVESWPRVWAESVRLKRRVGVGGIFVINGLGAYGYIGNDGRARGVLLIKKEPRKQK